MWTIRIGKKHALLSVALTAALALNLNGCVGNAVERPDKPRVLSAEDTMLKDKFRGIHGGVLYFDASGHAKEYVTMQSQSGSIWHATNGGFSTGAQQMTFTDAMYIPRTLRVIWRTGDVRAGRSEKGSDYNKHGFIGGTILGDYTVLVAERISDDVLDYIRKNGGALRLKIRLKDDGVLIGWDVEERFTTQYGRGVRWVRPGGDFREAQIFNGKVTDPGWQN